MGRKIAMYKTIDSDVLNKFEEIVPKGKRTEVLEKLMLQYTKTTLK